MDKTLILFVVLMSITIVLVLAIVLIVKVVYKRMPYRKIATKKPSLALLPKYKTEVTLADELVDSVALEKRLASFGFKKSLEKDGRTYFVRGSTLGDFSFSIKHIKVKLGFKNLQQNRSEITLESGSPIALDTGDCWTFLTELSQKLEKNVV